MRAKMLGLLSVGLLAGPVAANATSISWALENVTLYDGSALTGTFTTDAGTSQFLTYDFTMSGGPFSGYVFSSSLSSDHILFSSPNQLMVVTNDWSFREFFQFDAPLLPTQFSDPVNVVRFYCNACSNYAPYTTTGAAVQVPEPATLSLLGLGLAGVGFMRRRKKS
jgi:hypothetical protein